ncbi:hypothetical protein HZR23_11055 [Serpentinicella alkaliphila]|nr:hypothetical protein [Serpentinicella alkaliphila]QUH26211.1 hypothetical protein HZR23_11055 [Serpentinicella alkaliphila]
MDINMKKLLIILLTVLLFAIGCTSTQTKNVLNPDEIITQYAEAISNKDAKTIVLLYGGDYEFMEIFSEEQYRNDKEKVVENYLKVIPEKIYFNEIQSKNEVGKDEFEYEVTFKTENGSIFEVGDSETRNGVFKYIVRKVDGQYKVMDVPPYQP